MKHILAVAIIYTLIASMAASAADEKCIDFEYLPSSIYSNVIGVGFYHSKNEDIGLFFNIQTSLAKREPQYDTLSVTSFGDPVTKRYTDLTLINIGGVKRFGDMFSGYIGAGYASVRGIAQKYDPSHILGTDGTYYVNDQDNDKTGANINTGILIGFEKLVLNIGYHSYAQNINLGIGSKF